MCFTTNSASVRIKTRTIDYQITPEPSKGKNSNCCFHIHMIEVLRLRDS